MNEPLRVILCASTMTVLVGCGVLEPRYHQPELPVVNEWPISATSQSIDHETNDRADDKQAEPASAASSAADIGWRDFFADERLQKLIELSLQNNRDLRVAVANIERARGIYRI